MLRFHLPKGISVYNHCSWRLIDTDNYASYDFVRLCHKDNVYKCIAMIQAEEVLTGVPTCDCDTDGSTRTIEDILTKKPKPPDEPKGCSIQNDVSGCSGDSYYFFYDET